MITDKNAANAVGGKTARACDNCVRRRARWFCAADDAFLCQSCDSTVHSANSLARRHERVRLKTASFCGDERNDVGVNSLPTWHRGFTRKARTPRHGKVTAAHHRPVSKSEEGPNPNSNSNPGVLVPELGADDPTSPGEENEAQLLYRVPIFDPFEAAPVSYQAESNKGSVVSCNHGGRGDHDDQYEVDNLTSFLPSDMELEEFAADVEVLLGKGLEQECFGMEELGLLGDCKEEEDSTFVKVKDEEGEEHVFSGGCHSCVKVDDVAAREPFELGLEDFDDVSGAVHPGKEEMKENEEKRGGGENEVKKKKTISLRLDYKAVIRAWAEQGSPWTGGDRPMLNPNDCWLDCLGASGGEVPLSSNEELGGIGGRGRGSGDGGREARVSRYREKRRTRLFSKKIRYEVRKLNAEKRPRMKGRFVKRASFLGSAASTPFPLLNK